MRMSEPTAADAFAELGLPRTAALDADTLARAFDALSRERHPDAGGEAAAFARLTSARDTLATPSRRWRHLLELLAPGTKLDGALSPALMDLFAQLGPALAAGRAALERKSAASSALARALLAGEELRAREALETLAGRIDALRAELDARATDWRSDTHALATLAREAAFLEKWHAQVRDQLARLGL